MTEREQLISKLKTLVKINAIKQKQYQEENGLSPDCGCITREGCEMASLYPQMQKLDVTFDDVRKSETQEGI